MVNGEELVEESVCITSHFVYYVEADLEYLLTVAYCMVLVVRLYSSDVWECAMCKFRLSRNQHWNTFSVVQTRVQKESVLLKS